MAESFYLDGDLSGASEAFDNAEMTLGGGFQFGVDGQVTHIRYRAHSTAGAGAYVGALWQVTDSDPGAGSGDGTLLGQATFGTVTGGAWNTVALPSPANVTAGVVYRAGVYTQQGRYLARGSFHASAAITRGNITAIRDNVATGGFTLRNGSFFYAAGLSYPQDGFNGAAYFVDVVFEPPGAGYVRPTIVIPRAAVHRASRW